MFSKDGALPKIQKQRLADTKCKYKYKTHLFIKYVVPPPAGKVFLKYKNKF